jgi:hypothetical protein
MEIEPQPDDYADENVYANAWDVWKNKQISLDRTPKGHRMPETREQFNAMGDLYEAGYLREKKINSELRAENANLRNKLNKRS